MLVEATGKSWVGNANVRLQFPRCTHSVRPIENGRPLRRRGHSKEEGGAVSVFGAATGWDLGALGAGRG
jgi:hypothetical protein